MRVEQTIRRRPWWVWLLVLVLAMPIAAARAQDAAQEGLVSWYGAEFHDRLTAAGERFDPGALTMAHPTLPFGTRVRVTNLVNGRSVEVRVNDRGPHIGRRIADLSHAAAARIGMVRRGIVLARIEVLGAGRSTR